MHSRSCDCGYINEAESKAGFSGRSFLNEQICSKAIHILLPSLYIFSFDYLCFPQYIGLTLLYFTNPNYFLFPSVIEMIVTSGNSSMKKLDSVTLNNILLRTEGFKHVFRGLTYKPNKPATNLHSGNHTSIGKRTPAKEYTLTKDS